MNALRKNGLTAFCECQCILLNKSWLLTDSGVEPLERRSDTTGRTQPVRPKPRPQHGLGTIRSTLFRREFRAGIVTTPESVMSLKVLLSH